MPSLYGGPKLTQPRKQSYGNRTPTLVIYELELFVDFLLKEGGVGVCWDLGNRLKLLK